jgi:hypothetical protein
MWLEPLFGTLQQGFALWNTKEGNKYRDEVIKLRQEYSDEKLKPKGDQSDLAIIRIKRRMRVLYRTFIEFGVASKPKGS